MAPFRQLFAFVFFDGNFNAAEDFFADLADSAAQSIHCLGCIEVKNRHEILCAKVDIFHQTTPGKQGVGGAYGGCVDECHAFVEVMIPLQMRSVNDVENVLLVGKKILCDFDGGNLFQLINEITGVLNVVLFLHSGRNHLLMLQTVFPEIGTAGAFGCAGIRYIEHIFQLRSVPGVIDKGDALCAPADITPHSLVPQFVICAGGGFGTLGVDHQLLMVGVFIQSGCGGQEVCPALVAAGDL
ncbi:MAG: hypothetical protein SPE19_00635 [Candidatus Faecousia sp.]|nr:hypothetical protein [Bacillota bacterium]MDY4489025.1 hypothetical protein [Candidatus Faecousia sp.]MDY6160242.1 hypothetical protein [Candidatus Faecousia sp.]